MSFGIGFWLISDDFCLLFINFFGVGFRIDFWSDFGRPLGHRWHPVWPKLAPNVAKEVRNVEKIDSQGSPDPPRVYSALHAKHTKHLRCRFDCAGLQFGMVFNDFGPSFPRICQNNAGSLIASFLHRSRHHLYFICSLLWHRILYAFQRCWASISDE